MKKLMSIFEGILQAFVGLGALSCGMLFLLFPKGTMLQMPISMLKGSPFTDFFWPGLILFAVIGLGHGAAAVMSFRSHRFCGQAGAMMGLGLMIWIFVQVSMIGGGHWLQYLYFALGTVEVSLAVLRVAEARVPDGIR